MIEGPALQRLYRALPHAGSMRLINRVVLWDQRRILGQISNHRDLGHPMRQGGVLPAMCALEYAAQAAALHGVLASAGHDQAAEGLALKRAVVVTVRWMRLHCEDLASFAPDLLLEVECVFEQSHSAVFDFGLRLENPHTGQATQAAPVAVLAQGQFGVMVGR